MKTFWHICTFDGARWEKVSEVEVIGQRVSYGVAMGDSFPVGKEMVFKNVCLKCGDLHFRRVQELEQP